jgi:DNA polymerase/3'-5' exonuclease PolX
VLKLFRDLLWTGKERSYKYYAEGCRSMEDLAKRTDLDWKQKLGLQYFDDLQAKVPRGEVEAFARQITAKIKEIDVKATLTILGSYCRGEDPCSDCDFLISHPELGKENKVLDLLVAKLQQSDIVLNVLNLDNKYAPSFGSAQSRADSWWRARPDHRELSFRLIMCLAKIKDKVRRIDLFVCSKRSIGPTTLYLSGNVWFNRRLRYFAEQKGYYLCNSAMGKKIGPDKVESVETQSEQDVFKELGIEYVEPCDRLY